MSEESAGSAGSVVEHCPFLNRSDPRCTESSFKLHRLSHALGFCFDRYQACSVYRELLSERRARHARNARNTGNPNVFVQLTLSAQQPARHAKQESVAA